MCLVATHCRAVLKMITAVDIILHRIATTSSISSVIKPAILILSCGGDSKLNQFRRANRIWPTMRSTIDFWHHSFGIARWFIVLFAMMWIILIIRSRSSPRHSHHLLLLSLLSQPSLRFSLQSQNRLDVIASHDGIVAVGVCCARWATEERFSGGLIIVVVVRGGGGRATIIAVIVCRQI